MFDPISMGVTGAASMSFSSGLLRLQPNARNAKALSLLAEAIVECDAPCEAALDGEAHRVLMLTYAKCSDELRAAAAGGDADRIAASFSRCARMMSEMMRATRDTSIRQLEDAGFSRTLAEMMVDQAIAAAERRAG